MEGQDIKGLMEAYSKVYGTDEVLNEEVVEEGVEQLMERGAPTDPKARAAYDATVAKNRAALGNTILYGNAAGRKPPTLSRQTNVRGGGTRKPTAPTPAAPAAPAPTKPAVTPAAKPTAAPSATKPASKPAGSAMDAWAKANPKLAQAQKIRKEGGSRAEVNKVLYNKGTAAAEKTPTVVKAGVDIFDLVKGHLLDEGYAETEENALVMMSNMSEEWRESIIMELTGGKGHPGYKAGSKDHGDLEDHPAAGKKGGVLSPRYGHHLGDMDDEDEDEDDLESTVKQQSRDSRERVRKPLRDKVKAARKKMTKEGIELEDILALSRRMERVYEAQAARENPEKHEEDEEKENEKKYGKVRGEKTPMPPRGDKRREDFEKWYAKQMGR